MEKLIEQASHIVLIAHVGPDADSLGSACAMYSHLLRLNKKITLFCRTQEPSWHLSCLPWFDKLSSSFPEKADLAISFDCGTYGRLGIEYQGPLINIDHHQSNELFGSENYVDTSAISTTQLLYRWFINQGVKINGKMATALYAGLLDDSKSFTDSRCDQEIFEMAHSLIGLGADHETVSESLFQSKSLASLRLKGMMLQEMRLVSDGRIAIFNLNVSHLEHSGASLEEAKDLLEEAMSLKRVETAVMIAEHPKGGVKLSIRCKRGLNAATVMESFGGGGHRDRAGARVFGMDAKQAEEKLLDMILKERM